jgi:hypothetical protein
MSFFASRTNLTTCVAGSSLLVAEATQRKGILHKHFTNTCYFWYYWGKLFSDVTSPLSQACF